MKPGWICTLHKHKILKQFLQPKMHCFYIQDGLCTKVESGVDVKKLIKTFHHQKILVGWTVVNYWVPNWTTEAEASKECREFVKCACTTV